VASFECTGPKSLRFSWNPAMRSAALHDAVASGIHIPKLTVEMLGTTITLTGVLVTDFHLSSTGTRSVAPLPAPGVSL